MVCTMRQWIACLDEAGSGISYSLTADGSPASGSFRQTSTACNRLMCVIYPSCVHLLLFGDTSAWFVSMSAAAELRRACERMACPIVPSIFGTIIRQTVRAQGSKVSVIIKLRFVLNQLARSHALKSHDAKCWEGSKRKSLAAAKLYHFLLITVLLV